MKTVHFHWLSWFAVLAGTIVATGCNEPFSPKGPFEQRFVAYSVLDAGSNTQYVRLYLNYNPPGYDPNDIPGNLDDSTAQVTVTTAGQSYTFHDTLLGPSLHAFVNNAFSPKRGITYDLTAVSQRGSVTGQTTVPSQGDLGIANQSTLYYPNSFQNGNVEVQVQLGQGTKGFLVRFILDYSLGSDSTFHGEIEVPVSYQQNSAGVSTPQYPRLQRNTDPTPLADFPVANYLQVIADLTNQYATRILLKYAKFYLVQTDESLYNYYSIANGFQDKYSIRTDQPDFTNIQNGYGVFGSFSIDSLIVKY